MHHGQVSHQEVGRPKNEKERKYAGKFINLAEIGGNMHHWVRAVFPNQCLTEPKG